MPTYRTAGAWGPGIGVNLTPAQVDGNFYELRTDLDDVIANPPAANSIESITASGFTWTVTLTDGTILDPLAVPVVYTVWRGDWAPSTIYSAADLFRVSDQGIFAVLQNHTSAPTFDPDEAGGSPLAAYYTQLIGVASLPADTLLNDLNDVTITGIADGDILVWDDGSSQWVNAIPADVLSLALGDLNDVLAPSPSLGQVLTWTGSPASWQPAAAGAATLDALTDVSVPGPTDGQVLTYQTGSPTGWIAASPASVPTTLDALTDVAALAPADGDFLQYESGSPAGWRNQAGTTVSSLAAATAPFTGTGLLEVSEPAGSPAIYTSKKITVDALFTTRTVAGTWTLPGSGQLDSSGHLGLGTAPTVANAWLYIAGTTGAVAALERNDASDSLVSVFSLRRSRSDATAPGSGFGAAYTFNLEGFTNNSTPTAAQISSTWENAQTNDTTDRNADLRLSTMLANAVAVKAKLTSGGLFVLGPGAVATSAFPALKRSSATMQVRLGDDSAYADLYCRNTVQNPPASVTPANNGEMVVEATSNTSLTFKYKGSDGTVRSAGLTLA